MTRRTAYVAWLLLSTAFFGLTGCSTVAKQAFRELRGAQADVLLVEKIPATALARYQSVRFAPVTTTLGDRLCPPSVVRAYNRCAEREQNELARYFPGGVPELVLNGEILHFQSRGILSGAQLLTRVKMYDGGRVVADAIVNTESKSFREGGGGDLAETCVEALGKLLRKHKQRAAEQQDAARAS